MLQIQNALVSLDVIEKYFCCDLDVCHGACCIEGDAGAPVTIDEVATIEEEWHKAAPFMQTKCIEKVEKEGVAYVDQEGDLVTTIIDGKDCAFTHHCGDMCLCALEKVYRERKSTFCKPISCALYPVRITEYPTFTAVNLHMWNICKCAFQKGEKEKIRVYEFLKEPLIRRFGQEWYEELDLTARIYLEEQGK